MIYSYSLWASDTTPPAAIEVKCVPAVPAWAKLNTIEMEVRHNRYYKQNDYNFWAYSDKPLNKNKLMSLFRQLKKVGANAKVLDLAAYYKEK